MSKSILSATAVGLFVAMLAGCETESRGFALPVGDVDAGKTAFVQLGCNQCHSVTDQIDKTANGNADIHFKLGGTTGRVRTYGELVTSIINPNHKVSGYRAPDGYTDGEGNSKMTSMNDTMTVQQLVDLTTFLQTTYQLVRPQPIGVYYL